MSNYSIMCYMVISIYQNIIKKHLRRIMMELEKIVSNILNGEEFLTHPYKGYNRKNCLYVKSKQDIPPFLLQDGAIEVNENSITLRSIAHETTRQLPIYICYDVVSQEHRNRVTGEFCAWPKNDGSSTIQIINGRCYNPAKTIRAAVLSDKTVPHWVISSGLQIKRDINTYELIRAKDKQGKNIRRGIIGESIWVEYKRGDIDIIGLDEISKAKYIVTTIDGKDVGLLDVFLKEKMLETA